MANYFVWDGTSSAEFGVYIGGQDTFGAPARDVEEVSIPGRNGVLLQDNKRWRNIVIPYNVVIMDDFADSADAFNAWLHSVRGYKKLEDTYHPDHFRLAALTNGIEYKTASFNNAGKTVIQFNCKPQKFRKTGDIATQVTSGSTITNPTLYNSNPLIKAVCSGSGTLTVSGKTVTVTNYTGTLYIDSELQDCYDSSKISKNQYVSLSAFPVLVPGSNTISWSGNISGVEITGRWFDI